MGVRFTRWMHRVFCRRGRHQNNSGEVEKKEASHATSIDDAVLMETVEVAIRKQSGDEAPTITVSSRTTSIITTTSTDHDDPTKVSVPAVLGGLTETESTAPLPPPTKIYAPIGPRAGSSTLKYEAMDGCDMHEEDFRKTEESLQVKCVRWCSLPGEEVAVRSIDYRRSHRKVPSQGELYECIKVDFVESPHRLASMSSRVELPQGVNAPDRSTSEKTWHAPNILS